jgi:hypothetical protein
VRYKLPISFVVVSSDSKLRVIVLYLYPFRACKRFHGWKFVGIESIILWDPPWKKSWETLSYTEKFRNIYFDISCTSLVRNFNVYRGFPA